MGLVLKKNGFGEKMGCDPDRKWNPYTKIGLELVKHVLNQL